MSPLEESEKIIQAVGERKVLREDEAKSILRAYGIPTTDFHLVKSLEELNGLELRFPVALKVCSEDILHKTEVGGVKLNLGSIEDVKKELENMINKFPDTSFLIEPMEKGNFELIIGLLRDATFGLTIMTGIGGILTELYKDVSFRVVPINEYDAQEMLEDLKARKLFEGFRGLETDKKMIVNLLQKVSRLGEDLNQKIDQMDLNPILVRERDAVVVDAKLLLK